MTKRDMLYWPMFVLCWPVLLLIALLMGIMAAVVIVAEETIHWLTRR